MFPSLLTVHGLIQEGCVHFQFWVAVPLSNVTYLDDVMRTREYSVVRLFVLFHWLEIKGHYSLAEILLFTF